MTAKKEMDLLVISPAKHLTPEIREALKIGPDVDGYTVVHVLKNQKKPDLDTLQHLVGGLIERVPVYWHKHTLDGWINEEGKLTGLEPNMIGTVLMYNPVLAKMKLPVWDDFSLDPLPFIKKGWAATGTRDYVAGPMVIYSSLFKEMRHVTTPATLQ